MVLRRFLGLGMVASENLTRLPDWLVEVLSDGWEEADAESPGSAVWYGKQMNSDLDTWN